MILGLKFPSPPVKLPLDGRKPQNVSEWIGVATWNLVPSAKDRVRPEIAVHYAEAVQMHLARGASEIEAAAAALADLGDAKAAAKRFRQQYLTTLEINELEALKTRLRSSRNPTSAFGQLVALIGFCIISLIQIVAWIYGHPVKPLHYLFLAGPVLVFLITDVSLTILAGILARKKPTLTTARQFSSLGTIKILNPQILVIANSVFIIVVKPGDMPVWYRDILVIVLGVSIVANLVVAVWISQKGSRLRKKLASASEDDLPPDPSAA